MKDDTTYGMTDVPILNHLTYKEAHLFLVGLWWGLDAAVDLATGRPRQARARFQEAREYATDEDQQRTRPDLLPNFIRNAWYLFAGMTAGFVGGLYAISTAAGPYVGRLVEVLPALL